MGMFLCHTTSSYHFNPRGSSLLRNFPTLIPLPLSSPPLPHPSPSPPFSSFFLLHPPPLFLTPSTPLFFHPACTGFVCFVLLFELFVGCGLVRGEWYAALLGGFAVSMAMFIMGPEVETTQFMNRDRFGGDYFFVGCLILSAMCYGAKRISRGFSYLCNWILSMWSPMQLALELDTLDFGRDHGDGATISR